jgi:hypothetical protein
MDGGRMVIALVLLAGIFAAWYFVLPWIRALFLPTASGGVVGPWMVYPNVAARFCACAFLSAVSLPFVMIGLRKRWNDADAAAGTRYDPFRGRPLAKIGPYLAGSVLCVIYGLALYFYFSCWAIVGPAGIDDRGPWRRKTHSFDQITSLEVVTRQMRHDDDHLIGNDGPWHKVAFVDGGTFDFGPEHEGCSEADISAIEKFIAQRSGKAWRVRGIGAQR